MTDRLLIDTDPGVDDSLALVAAAAQKQLPLAGITTVFGNHTVTQTTGNAIRLLAYLKVLRILDHDVPVSRGSAAPLCRRFRPFFDIHGVSGLGRLSLPAANQPAPPPLAENFIYQQIMKYPGRIRLLCLGPLTNIAKFARRHPVACRSVKELVVMGGTVFLPGNYSPHVEANFARDPEAAKIVFESSFRQITLVPLDVTETVQITAQKISRIADSRLRQLFSDLTETYIAFYRHTKKTYLYPASFKYIRYSGGAVHDLAALFMCLGQNRIFRTVSVPVKISVSGDQPGQLIVSGRGESDSTGFKTVRLAASIDSRRFWSSWVKIFPSYD